MAYGGIGGVDPQPQTLIELVNLAQISSGFLTLGESV